ncbi:hypothetical protein E2C01_079435 [Portunus trituberculatus]|uniref:Uncharacterized protein n=1 Tax=Portunus trituberculatus TaxID=210409 RepID=A0A5B7IRE9_PORTR|nr:hypothetical protein [Portunus trituberculatus]
MLFSAREGVLVLAAGLTGRCVVEEADATLPQYPSVGSGLSDDGGSLTTPASPSPHYLQFRGSVYNKSRAK